MGRGSSVAGSKWVPMGSDFFGVLYFQRFGGFQRDSTNSRGGWAGGTAGEWWRRGAGRRMLGAGKSFCRMLSATFCTTEVVVRGRNWGKLLEIQGGIKLKVESSGCEDEVMRRDQAIATLRAHEAELRAAGVESASLFGSVARDEPSAQDVDVAVRLGDRFSRPGFEYFRRLDELERQLAALLACKVDVVEEPVRKERFQKAIDRDRALAF